MLEFAPVRTRRETPKRQENWGTITKIEPTHGTGEVKDHWFPWVGAYVKTSLGHVVSVLMDNHDSPREDWDVVLFFKNEDDTQDLKPSAFLGRRVLRVTTQLAPSSARERVPVLNESGYELVRIDVARTGSIYMLAYNHDVEQPDPRTVFVDWPGSHLEKVLTAPEQVPAAAAAQYSLF